MSFFRNLFDSKKNKKVEEKKESKNVLESNLNNQAIIQQPKKFSVLFVSLNTDITAIANNYINILANIDPFSQTSIGIDFKTISYDENTFRLQTNAGQERFTSLSGPYKRFSAFVFLPETKENLDKMLTAIKNDAGQHGPAFIILVPGLVDEAQIGLITNAAQSSNITILSVPTKDNRIQILSMLSETLSPEVEIAAKKGVVTDFFNTSTTNIAEGPINLIKEYMGNDKGEDKENISPPNIQLKK